MSSPISGSPSPIIPSESTAPIIFTETPFGADLSGDTQSTAIGPNENPNVIIPQPTLDESRITISEFSAAVLGQLDLSRQTLHESVQTYIDSVRSQGFLRLDLGNLVASIALANLAANLSLRNLRNDQNSQINLMNAVLLTYNVAVGDTTMDTNQRDFMNNAIQLYNAGTIDEETFNGFATAYNLYANARNTQLGQATALYNSAKTVLGNQITANNQTITDTINPERIANGLEPVDLQTDPTQAITAMPIQAPSPPIPVPEISGGPQILNIIPPIPGVPASTIISLIGTALMSLIPDPFSLPTTYDVLANGVDQVSNNLNFQDPTVAVSFVDRIPSASLGSDAVSSTGATSLSILTGASSGQSSTGSLQNQIEETDLRNYVGELTLNGYQELSAFESQTSASLGLFSAIPGLRLIGATGLTSASPTTAFGMAFGITHDQIVSDYVSSGAIEEGVRAIIEADIARGAAIDNADRAIAAISNEIKANLLQTALFVSSQVTSAPGLGSAVIASSSGLTSQDLAVQSQLTADQVLSDNLKTAYLKTNLAQSLAASANIDAEQAQSIINDSVDASIAQGDIEDAADLQQRIQSNLVLNGINEATALELAQKAADIVTAETTPQGFQSGNLFNQDQVVSALSGQLSGLGYDVGSASSLASQAASALFANGIATNAVEYRISLEDALIRQGLTAEGAREAATGVIASLNIAPSDLSSIQQNGSNAILSVSEIQAEYYNLLVEGLTPSVGADTARSIAEQGVNALLGSDQSILTQLNEVQATRETYGLDTATQLAVNDYRELQSPNVDLYTTSQRLMDPANALFMSAATGLTYAGIPTPTNYKKSIDIQV